MSITDYDAIADQYAALRMRDLELNGDPLFSFIQDGIAGCKVVVDAGCGSGEDLPRFAARADQVIGIDRSDAMLRHARKYAGPQVHLVRADLRQPPLKAGSADAIVSRFALQYIDDVDVAYRGFARILRTNGSLVLLLPHPRLGEAKRKHDGCEAPLIDVPLFGDSICVRYRSFPLSHFISDDFNSLFDIIVVREFALGSASYEPTALGLRARKRSTCSDGPGD